MSFIQNPKHYWKTSLTSCLRCCQACANYCAKHLQRLFHLLKVLKAESVKAGIEILIYKSYMYIIRQILNNRISHDPWDSTWPIAESQPPLGHGDSGSMGATAGSYAKKFHICPLLLPTLSHLPLGGGGKQGHNYHHRIVFITLKIQKWGGGRREKAHHLHIHTHHTKAPKQTALAIYLNFACHVGSLAFLPSSELALWFRMQTIMPQDQKHLYTVHLNNVHTLPHSSKCKRLTKEPRRNCCESCNIYWTEDICLQITTLPERTFQGS